MEQYISKSALVAEIEKLKGKVSDDSSYCNGWQHALRMLEIELNTLEVKDPYEQCIQYDSIKAGIQAHAETYSFNIESHLFPQLTKEQQALWRKEIEQACISGGDMGYSLAKDPRYKENFEVKEVDLEKELIKWHKEHFKKDGTFIGKSGFYLTNDSQMDIAKHFYLLGLAQKGE